MARIMDSSSNTICQANMLNSWSLGQFSIMIMYISNMSNQSCIFKLHELHGSKKILKWSADFDALLECLSFVYRHNHHDH